MPQYTIRNVPESIDRKLRESARSKGVSLNKATLDAICRGLGVAGESVTYDDLDDLVGTWQQDSVFDRSIEEQDRIDPELWQ